MEEKFQYIVRLSTEYSQYVDSPDALYTALNSLDQDRLSEILEEYDRPDLDFRPANLLRAELARQLAEGGPVSKATVEELKLLIRNGEVPYFEGRTPPARGNKGDMFKNWSRDWSIFYTFFYRGEVKRNVQSFLKEISEDMRNELALPDYAARIFDFQGTRNDGQKLCWIGLYPRSAVKHKNAYQLALSLSAEPKAGRQSGSEIEAPKEYKEVPVNSYEETLSVLRVQRDEVVDLNAELERSGQFRKGISPEGTSRRYFKFSLGENSSEWDRFKSAGFIGADYNELALTDISDIESLAKLNAAAGFEEDNTSRGATWNLWEFKRAAVGDVVFATRGTKTCLGIGIIDSEYYFDFEAEKEKHRRRIKWIVDQTY